MQVSEIIRFINETAPFLYQETYDNSGLQIGKPDAPVTGILITLDITEEVLEEALQKNCNLILSHHPLIFSNLKTITGKNSTEKIILKAIRENINILSAHTNLDNSFAGVNNMICQKLKLERTGILSPLEGKLVKLVVFVPETHAEKVRTQIFNAGAGVIGNYDSCSFNIKGSGSFKGNEMSDPFAGEKGKLHFENEIRIETILPVHLKEKVINVMLESHPYEEVAYDLYPLQNEYNLFGSGMYGYLSEPAGEREFILKLRDIFKTGCIKHSRLSGKKIQKVAVSGGSGSFLLKEAIRIKADIFISGDFKYHQFFEAENKILITDIGHYESEQFTKELFYELLMKKIPNFALHLSKINTNPIYYL